MGRCLQAQCVEIRDWAKEVSRCINTKLLRCEEDSQLDWRQIWGRCVASANSPLALVRRGVQQYLDLGVPASKIVLGLPWCPLHADPDAQAHAAAGRRLRQLAEHLTCIVAHQISADFDLLRCLHAFLAACVSLWQALMHQVVQKEHMPAGSAHA